MAVFAIGKMVQEHGAEFFKRVDRPQLQLTEPSLC